MNADSIKIESDEDGFHLVLQLDEEIPLVTNEGRLDVRINDCADALHEQVNLIIGSWLAEGEQAKRQVNADMERYGKIAAWRAFGLLDRDESGGVAENSYDRAEAYDQSDPKHKDWHSVHADLYDNREKV